MMPLIGIALGIIVLIGVGFTVVSTVFHRATVSVTLRSFQVPVSGSFEASPTGANLAFATKTADESLSKTVPSTGTQHVSLSASGTITVRNTGATSQKLIATTRFEATGGHIYRIKAPITVPAGHSVDATVYADQPGDAYNFSGPADLTIPGLKGSAQFTTVTGHLTGSIAGGFVGDKAVVSDADHAQAVADLSKALGDKARATLAGGIGPDDLIFPGSIVVVMSTDPDKSVTGGASVTVHATASAPVFSMAAVAHVIASEGSIDTPGPLVITNIAALSPAVTPSKTAGNVTLTLAGTASLKGSYDQKSLIQSLAGKNRRDVGATLSAYPAIADMKISVYPFWSTTLPTDPSRITVTETVAPKP
jgi:hypothetical protein